MSKEEQKDEVGPVEHEAEKVELELGGMKFKFKNSVIIVLITVFSSIGGSLWVGFEFYKDYMDMREIVSHIDVNEIESRNKQIEIKLDEAIDYSRSIKNDLRDDFNRMEKNVDRVEDQVREMETTVEDIIDRASERFDTKRESLQTDTEIKIRSVEDRLNKKIQLSLDNPLAN